MTRAELRRARQQAEEERRRAEDAERQRHAQEVLAEESADEFDDVDESRAEDAEYAPEGDLDDTDAAEPETAATPIITAVPRAGRTGTGATGDAATRPDDFDDVVGPQRNEKQHVTHAPQDPAAQAPDLQDPAPQAAQARPASPPADEPSASAVAEPTVAQPAVAASTAARAGDRPGAADADDRQTFLRHDEDLGELPAQQGLRGFLNRLGFSLEPTGEELRDRARRARVGRRVGRPRTVSIVNGKGGANKTPTTVLLAAVFGRNSSQSVLAWDNNGTRGTLGWRTAKDAHEGHVMNLLHDADRLLGVSPTELSIDGYVHYQQTDRFSVLRTEPTLLAAEQSVSSKDFDTLHEVVSRYFQLTFVDSGNDESAERWLRMIDHTDQLVIASTTVEEHAEAGALLLAALTKRGGRYAELARNAVVVVSQQSPNINPGQLRRIRRGFEDLARDVVTVPYDPHLVKGKIRYDALKPATQRAWLEAAAAVSDGLVDAASEPAPQ
ncbi:MinD/ParA family ATP-binding protein [Zhihengliuella alba]